MPGSRSRQLAVGPLKPATVERQDRRDHARQCRGELRARHKLAESTDVAPAMELQSEQVRKQMDNFVHQLEEMRDLTTKIIQDANPAKTDIGDALTVRNQARRVEQQQRLVLSLVRRRLHAGRSARLLGRSEGPAGIVADVVEGLVDGAAPAVADGLQVRVVILKPYGEVLLERAAAIDQEIERRPDRDVRAHGRIRTRSARIWRRHSSSCRAG